MWVLKDTIGEACHFPIKWRRVSRLDNWKVTDLEVMRDA